MFCTLIVINLIFLLGSLKADCTISSSLSFITASVINDCKDKTNLLKLPNTVLKIDNDAFDNADIKFTSFECTSPSIKLTDPDGKNPFNSLVYLSSMTVNTSQNWVGILSTLSQEIKFNIKAIKFNCNFNGPFIPSKGLFAGWKNLNSVDIVGMNSTNNNKFVVSEELFKDCPNLISIPSAYSYYDAVIGKRAFSGCKGLNSDIIQAFFKNNNIQKIEDGAFEKISVITLKITNDKLTLGNRIFDGSTIDTLIATTKIAATNLTFNNLKVKSLTTNSDLISLFADILNTIPQLIFDSFKNFTHFDLSSVEYIAFPYDTETIEDRAFTDCPNLSVVSFRSSTYFKVENGMIIDIKMHRIIAVIPKMAVETIKIPLEYTTYSPGLFYNIQGPRKIILPMNYDYDAMHTEDWFNDKISSNVIFYVPSDHYTHFATVGDNKVTFKKLSEAGSGVVIDCANKTSCSVGIEVELGIDTFLNYDNVSTIKITKNTTPQSINYRAFVNMRKLSNIEYSNTTRHTYLAIGSGAIVDIPSKTLIYLPPKNDLTNLDVRTIYSYTSTFGPYSIQSEKLESIVINFYLTKIERNAFASDLRSLVKFTGKGSPYTSEAGMLVKDKTILIVPPNIAVSLTNATLEIPNACTGIASHSFDNVVLTKIIVPESIETVANDAFSSSTFFDTAVVPNRFIELFKTVSKTVYDGAKNKDCGALQYLTDNYTCELNKNGIIVIIAAAVIVIAGIAVAVGLILKKVRDKKMEAIKEIIDNERNRYQLELKNQSELRKRVMYKLYIEPYRQKPIRLEYGGVKYDSFVVSESRLKLEAIDRSESISIDLVDKASDEPSLWGYRIASSKQTYGYYLHCSPIQALYRNITLGKNITLIDYHPDFTMPSSPKAYDPSKLRTMIPTNDENKVIENVNRSLARYGADLISERKTYTSLFNTSSITVCSGTIDDDFLRALTGYFINRDDVVDTCRCIAQAKLEMESRKVTIGILTYQN